MSVLMAPLAAVFGQDAIFWLTPIAAFVLVLSAFAIARQLAGGMAGATAAILTATSPIVLYQAVQPMNDILTAALWLAALAAGRQHAVAGVLIGLRHPRPPEPCAAGDSCSRRFRSFSMPTREQQLRGLLAMIAGALPGVLLLLWLNQRPLRQRVRLRLRGRVASSSRVSHIDENLSNYSRALFQTQHVVPLIAPAGAVRVRRHPGARAPSLLLGLCRAS